MRPLARKIFLTQGLVIALVFGISLFAYQSLGEAQRRAERLGTESELGIAHKALLSELRDLGRSRAFYFLDKQQNLGERTEELQEAFYDSLKRAEEQLDVLTGQAGERDDLQDLIVGLRQELEVYKDATVRQELAVGLDQQTAYDQAAREAGRARERMAERIRESMDVREGVVAEEIAALRVSTRGAAALSLAFTVFALTFGLLGAFWLTRTIHQPVRDLRKATEGLARGEFDLRVDARRRDELGDLARAFNEMAARLHELDEMKSHFVSVVSHELKTPLTSMRDAVELLAEGVGGDLTERQKRLLDITREGMERLVAYIEGILDLTRFEAGQVRLIREPLLLHEVVAEQAELVRKVCNDSGLELEIEMDDDLPPVEGDRLRIGQVVANLLNNAIKFTPPGGKITVSGVVEPWQDRIGVGVVVSDTGRGIAPRDQKHVFEKFFQGGVSGPGDRRVQGAGLGLAIVKSLVEAHGGVVTLKSSPRKGSSFRILLPAAERLPAKQAATG